VLTHHDSVREAALAVDGVAVVSLDACVDLAQTVVLDDRDVIGSTDPLEAHEDEVVVVAVGHEHDVLVDDPMDLLQLVEFDTAITSRPPKKPRGHTA